jgi:hypothetical protein
MDDWGWIVMHLQTDRASEIATTTGSAPNSRGDISSGAFASRSSSITLAKIEPTHARQTSARP